eukprot:scaffold209574_cov26-Tisochrysis_lutea.AAC.1
MRDKAHQTSALQHCMHVKVHLKTCALQWTCRYAHSSASAGLCAAAHMDAYARCSAATEGK